MKEKKEQHPMIKHLSEIVLGLFMTATGIVMAGMYGKVEKIPTIEAKVQFQEALSQENKAKIEAKEESLSKLASDLEVVKAVVFRIERKMDKE